MRVQRLVIFESDHEALRGSNLKPPQANQSSYLLQYDGEDDDVWVTVIKRRCCERVYTLNGHSFSATFILSKKANKAVPLHAMVALGGRGGIASTHY
jgi:hypothetical protein